MSKISIVIPTFNSRPFLELCISSLFAQDFQDFEVIIVDNNSRDGTAGFIKAAYPKIILIENKQNFGACRARNQGIEASSGNWVMALDCDVILDKCFISNIFKTVKNLSSNVGMIQARILNFDKRTIYSTGISLSFFRRFYDIGKNKIDKDKFNTGRSMYLALVVQPHSITAACFKS